MRATVCLCSKLRPVCFVGGRYPVSASRKIHLRNGVLDTPPTLCQPHIIHSQRIVFPHQHGGPQSGAVSISSTGLIDSIHPSMSFAEANQLSTKLNRPLTSFGDNIVLSPGLIDVHCHISELGRDWEGYYHATRAAAAGGITTLMGMPLNSIPSTTTVEALDQEIEASCNVKMMADIGLWGGAVPSNTTTLDGMQILKQLLDAGVFGLKAFLAPLPADAGYETVSPEQLGQAARICGNRAKPLLVHSELMSQKEQDEKAEEAYKGRRDESYIAHVLSRPGKWEQDAVDVVCSLSKWCHMHVVHLSDAGCLDIIESTKQRLKSEHTTNGNLTVETCPHYLLFDLETLPDGDTRYKCFPPIREQANKIELWRRGLCQSNTNSLIDMIASDHSPCTPDLRLLSSGNVRKAWGGLSGLQYQLQSTLTALQRYIQYSDSACKEDNGIGLSNETLAQLAQWWSTAPSHLIPGLSTIKGCIDVGFQADLCAWDSSHVGKPNDCSSERHRWKGGSVYPEMELKGRIIGTWLRGIHVYDGESDAILEDDCDIGGAGSIMLNKM